MFREFVTGALMLSFVTFVSTLVFMYSIGYMHGDRGFNRFFAWLSLFAFSMLILVLAANTAFADFPRLASIVARDRFMPRQFMNLGDKDSPPTIGVW